MFEPLCNVFNICPIAHNRDQYGKLAPANARQSIHRAQLAFHPRGHFLEVVVPDLVPIEIVNLLELVEIDVNQAEDAGIEARVLDLGIEPLLEGEAVVHAGKQIELRPMEQVVIEPARLDGQGREAGGH